MNLRDAMEGVRSQYGDLTPQYVVDLAEKQLNKFGKFLHPRLEWDNAIAGPQYRLVQAAELIRSVRVVREHPITGETTSVRAYLHIEDPDRGSVYDPTEEVLANPLTRELAFREMERDWKSLKRKYEEFEEFAELVLSDMTVTA